ncbi:hypothetical protein CL656_05600 [bacterium]|nr:hypothetical protein [bacterium]|tara:strand:+ start:435 stop:1586 length:1152 start_codon:yes stop_codon:yes gene_type:complete
MSTYETLYKLKENGKIYLWSIEFIEIDNKFYTSVKHGQKDGKMIEHIKEIIPKAKRTPEEQFDIIASRKWNDKVDKEGYSTNEDIDSDDDDNEIMIRPMLAQTFDKNKYEGNKKCKKITFPCWGQPKFDGIRCLMYEKNGNAIMESRKGTQFYNFDDLREEFLSTIANEKNCIFDGELYTNNMSFEKLNGLVRLKKPKENQIDNINQIEYYIYDIIIKDNLDASYDERKKVIDKIYKKYEEHFNLIKFCPSIILKNINGIDKLHEFFVNDGFEGLILRNKKGKYEINKRSYDLQKYKQFMDEEFLIIDYTEGKGDEKGLIIFTCMTEKQKEFNVRPAGTREYRRELFENGDDCIGRNLTVMFQEYSSDGVPRFPVGKDIRYDK